MIVDKIENAHLYAPLSGKIAQALKMVTDKEIAKKETGRYDVSDDGTYYLVNRYETKPVEGGKLEAHEKYIDLQYVVSGRETLVYAPAGDLEIDTPYDKVKDYVLYNPPQNATPVYLEEGMFCILWPDDTHMPNRSVDGPVDVCKIVIKIPI